MYMRICHTIFDDTHGEILPDVCVAILSEALVVESVDLRDLTGFVVTAEDCDSLFVPDLELNHEILVVIVKIPHFRNNVHLWQPFSGSFMPLYCLLWTP